MRSFLVLIIFIILTVIGGTVFIWSGIYNVGANEPHWNITHKIIEELRDRSVSYHSKDIVAPSLRNPKLKEAGVHEYHEMCVRCHGAPGYPREEFAVGLYPNPPDFATENPFKEMGASEIFWVIKNGLKMTGMPSFGATHDEEDLWGIVAFLEGLQRMPLQEYKGRVTPSGGSEGEKHHHGKHLH